jgi:hypothetical protein
MTGAPEVSTLADARLLDAWERGDGRAPVERGLAPLTATRPREAAEELWNWPLGQRDAELLAIHEASFGGRIEAAATCPACREPLEVDVTAAQLSARSCEPHSEHELIHDGHRVRFRCPTSADVAAAARCPDPGGARALLVERCVVTAEVAGGRAVAPQDLPDAVIAALSSGMAEADPQADLRFELRCPECEHEWTASLDVADVVWRELDARARLLLADITRLAAGFGWNEAAILSLSPARRRAYLDLLGP